MGLVEGSVKALDNAVLMRSRFDGDKAFHHLFNNLLLIVLVLLCDLLQFLLSFLMHLASVA